MEIGARLVWDDVGVRSFGELVAEAAAADVTGWGFDWLNGRATEERPPWGYAKLLADRLSQVESALDIDRGGGEVLAEAPTSRRGWSPPRHGRPTRSTPANDSDRAVSSSSRPSRTHPCRFRMSHSSW